MTVEAPPAPSEAIAATPAPREAAVTVPNPGPKWYRIGFGDLVMLWLAIGIAQTASSGLIGDPGLGWHLRTPDYLLEHGWPTADPFARSPTGNHWLANQWLGDMPFWFGWKAAGLNGVVAVTIAFLLLGYRLLYGFIRADGFSWPVAAWWTYAAAMASFNIWVVRPTVFTFLAVAILARVLVLHNEGRLSSKRLWWLVALFVVWVNCHGGFVVGLAMIGLAAGIELLLALGRSELSESDAAKLRLQLENLGNPDVNFRARTCWNSAEMLRFKALCGVGIACSVATLINPYGWKVYPWVFSLLGDKYFMNLNTEWLSPDFHASGWIRLAGFMVMFPALFALSRCRPKLTILALSLFWLYLALQSQRYTPLWIIVTTPLMARAAAQIEWLTVRISRLGQDDFFQVRSGGWIGYFVIVAALAIWARCGDPIDHNKAIYPSEGLNELLRLRQPGEVVLNHPDFGGYLTMHGWPDLKVWIDDRNEVFGWQSYESYFDVERTRPGWEETLAQWNPDWIVTYAERPLAYRLAERKGKWEEAYRDKLVVVFRKKGNQ